jgi:hypothetical protein
MFGLRCLFVEYIRIKTMSNLPKPFKPPAQPSGDMTKYLLMGAGGFALLVIGMALGLNMGGSEAEAAIRNAVEKETAEVKSQLAKAENQLSVEKNQNTNLRSEADKLTKQLSELTESTRNKVAPDPTPSGNGSFEGLAREIQSTPLIGNEAAEKVFRFDPSFEDLMIPVIKEGRKKFIEDYQTGVFGKRFFNDVLKFKVDKTVFEGEPNPNIFSEDPGQPLFFGMEKGYFAKPYDGSTPDTKLDRKLEKVAIFCHACNLKDKNGKPSGGFLVTPDRRIRYQLIRQLALHGSDLTAFIADNRGRLLMTEVKASKDGVPSLKVTQEDIDRFVALLKDIKAMQSALQSGI